MPLAFTINPETGDLIDSADGWFEEDATASSAVQCQLTHQRNAWVGDPDAGSELHKVFEMGDGDDGQEFIRLELQRGLGVLSREQLIGNVQVEVQRADPGVVYAETSYLDLTSGQVVDQVVNPYGG